jgi:hypothetical protein
MVKKIRRDEKMFLELTSKKGRAIIDTATITSVTMDTPTQEDLKDEKHVFIASDRLHRIDCSDKKSQKNLYEGLSDICNRKYEDGLKKIEEVKIDWIHLLLV